jgi:predicted DNA-binding transcriptional regulator AlpA
MSKRYVSMQEASELLQVSYKTIQRKVKDGSFKSKKKGNSREILFDSLGIPEDTTTDNDRDRDKTKSETSPNEKGQDKEQTEVSFLRGMITKQQGTIEEQNGRLAELNRLVLGNQQTLAELSKTLQLTTGQNRTEETDKADIDLRQGTDTSRAEKDTKSTITLKNKPLQSSKKRLKVLLLVLIPLVVVLTVVGLMYFKVIPSHNLFK